MAKSEFLADGYQRALEGIAREARSEVEANYASQGNTSGIIRRWRLRREIEREIAKRVADRSKILSPDALY